MNRFETGLISHPRKSSDFCIQAQAEHGGKLYAVNGVLDTIGRPRRSRIKKVVREIKKAVTRLVAESDSLSLQEFDRKFNVALTSINNFTHEAGKRQSGLFGFCFAFAVSIDRKAIINWMGDCRCYHFKTEMSGNSGNTVECLTRDNNKLTTEMAKIDSENNGAEIEMLKNEMLELSRQLQLYLGIGSDQHFSDALADQSREIEIQPGNMIMLTTDGIVMPIVRYEVANAGFKLSMERLYLENWFVRYLENGEYLRHFKGIEAWRKMFSDMKDACLKYTHKRQHYRDDMALIYMA